MRPFGNERGQSLVEFSLCTFLMVMLLIGVVEISRLVLLYTTIANAARAGARFAVVHGTDSPATQAQVQAVVNNYLGAAPMNSTNATVNVCFGTSGSTCASGAGSGTAAAVGSLVTVQVSYPYDVLSSYFPFSVTLGSTSQGVITF